MLEGEINLRRIGKLFESVKRLNVQSGDLIVFHANDKALAHNAKFQVKVYKALAKISEKLKAQGIKDVTLWALGPDQTVASLSEADMNANGWYRKGA